MLAADTARYLCASESHQTPSSSITFDKLGTMRLNACQVLPCRKSLKLKCMNAAVTPAVHRGDGEANAMLK